MIIKTSRYINDKGYPWYAVESSIEDADFDSLRTSDEEREYLKEKVLSIWKNPVRFDFDFKTTQSLADKTERPVFYAPDVSAASSSWEGDLSKKLMYDRLHPELVIWMSTTRRKVSVGFNNFFFGNEFNKGKPNRSFRHIKGTGWMEIDDGNEPIKEPQPRPNTERDDGSVTDYRLLLSTRRMLGFLGVDYYDGPEFKFESNKHPSPSASYLPTLAKEYMMKVIIPNALLAVKYGSYVGPVALEALDYCMTTCKCQKSVDAWNTIKADKGAMAQITEKYNFYVCNVNRDGTEVKADHRCYFDKFVSLKCGDAKRFRRGKNTDVVDELLKRMEKEPELKNMSRRKLMEIGIPERAASQFIKARRKA